ncbi:MAG: T9SS type A sorting domain-containing protein [Bacteroidales bacterium]|jgi:hypothetical protein|nr:T9SS type A sorting domain-containing protein [Bacteroidales bacterium]
MKRVSMTLVFTACISCLGGFAQNQIRNGNFEQWDSVGLATEEPSHWNSFKSASGSLADSAVQQIKQSTQTHSAGGQYCAMIWARPVSSIVVNGVVTTGQVNLGSLTAADTTNYYVTRPGDDNFSAPLTKKPDSIAFWARFSCPDPSQTAAINATVHTNNEFREPLGNSSYVVARASQTFTQGDWTKFVVPFTSVSNQKPAFILVSFTTNAIPGVGSVQDTLWIDDVELLYIPKEKLSSIKLDNVDLPGFSADSNDYIVNLDSCGFPVVTATPADTNATVTVVQPTAATKQAVITVKNGTNTLTENIYTVSFTTPAPTIDTLYDVTGNIYTDTLKGVNGCDSIIVHLKVRKKLSSIELDGVALSGFSPDTNDYTVNLDSCNFPTVTAKAADTNATVTIVQATTATKQAVITINGTDSTSENRYTVSFITPAPTIDTLYDATGSAYIDTLKGVNGCDSIIVHLKVRAKLNSIKLDGVDLVGFSADTNNYTVQLDSCTFPTVSATSADTNATVTVVQATAVTKQAVITVITGTDSETENKYTVTFTTPAPTIDTLYDATGGAYTDTLKGVNKCDSIIVHLPPVGIVPIGLNQNAVSVYPNPAESFIYINSSYRITDIELYDMVGRLVRKESNVGQNQLKLNLDSLTKGVYSIRVITEKGIISKKVVLH